MSLAAKERDKLNAFFEGEQSLTQMMRDGVPEPTYLPSPSFGDRFFYEHQVFALSGHKKAGKSWAMTILTCDAIEDGRHVVYIDNEGGPELLVERLLLRGVDPAEVDTYLHYFSFPKLPGEAFIQELFELIAERWPACFVVLDSMRAVMAAYGLNPNVDVEVERLLGPIMAAVKSNGAQITVGLIEHANRKGSAADEHAAGGSQAKGAAVDATYFFTKLSPYSQSTEGAVSITMKDDRRGRLDFERFYAIGGQGPDAPLYFAQIDKAETGAGGRMTADIERLLDTEPGREFTLRAIRGKVTGKNTAVREAAERLVDDDETGVERGPGGGYVRVRDEPI